MDIATNLTSSISGVVVIIVFVVALLLSIIVTEDGSAVQSFVISEPLKHTKDMNLLIRRCGRVQYHHHHHHHHHHQRDRDRHRHRWRRPILSSSSYSVLRSSPIEYCDSLNDDVYKKKSKEATDDDEDLTTKMMMTKMTNFFLSMVDPSTNRFYYLYRYQNQLQKYPQLQKKKNEDQQQLQLQQQHENPEQFVHHHVPIRDLAASWDATKAVQFFYCNSNDIIDATTSFKQHQEQLLDAIRTTLSSYHLSQSSSTGRSFIDSSDLAVGEKPNIGHSAMWVLSAIGWKRIYDCQQRRLHQQDVLTRIDDSNIQSDIVSSSSSIAIDMTTTISNVSSLVDGILKQQNDNGSFLINFVVEDHLKDDDNIEDIQERIEFFPGEAMLALMEVYHESSSSDEDSISLVDETTCQTILSAMTKAFHFYSSYYDQHKQSLGTNYNIWQIQCFSRFFLALKDRDSQKNDNAIDEADTHFMDRLYDYVTTLCDDIVSSPAWRELNRGQSFYSNLQTLEIVCGLDAILDGLRVIATIVVKSSTCNTTGSSSSNDGNNNDETQQEKDEQIRLYRLHVTNAIDFIEWAQDQTINLNGGLGYGGLQVTEQRLDVTGHAISALSKLQYKN